MCNRWKDEFGCLAGSPEDPEIQDFLKKSKSRLESDRHNLNRAVLLKATGTVTSRAEHGKKQEEKVEHLKSSLLDTYLDSNHSTLSTCQQVVWE